MKTLMFNIRETPEEDLYSTTKSVRFFDSFAKEHEKNEGSFSAVLGNINKCLTTSSHE